MFITTSLGCGLLRFNKRRDQYAPKNANNYIAFNQYHQYRTLLETVYKKLQEQKPLEIPTKKEMSIKIDFDFFRLMQEPLTPKALTEFKKNIEGYTKKWDTSITIGNILTVLEGLIKITQNQSLPTDIIDLLEIKNDELNNVFQEKADNKEQCYQVAIRQDFNYTYLDKRMRNNIIKAYIDLLNNMDKREIERAKRFFNNLNDLINTQWGSQFPIDLTLKNELNNLEKTFTFTPPPSPRPSVKKPLEELIESLKKLENYLKTLDARLA